MSDWRDLGRLITSDGGPLRGVAQVTFQFSLVLSATSAGDPPGRRSHVSNMFLVNLCSVPDSRDSNS
jgi:hypothetical protein